MTQPEVPKWKRELIGAATLRAIQRTMQSDPELWARIEKRAAEIRERGEYPSGGK